MAETSKDRPIVVGVDGSRESLAALRWAADYATCVGAPLEVVTAWEHGTGFGFVPTGHGSLEAEAHRILERAVHRVLGEPPEGCSEVVVEGRPEDVLVARAKGARLLVVGDRGYSSVAGLLIGHCGEACVRRAACSVVVIRGE